MKATPMVPVTFWLQLLLLVFTVGQSAAHTDIPVHGFGPLKNKTKWNKIQKELQTSMKCRTETGNQDNIFGAPMTEEQIKTEEEELRGELKKLQATIDRQTKTEEANNQMIQQLSEKRKQLKATIDFQKKTMEEMIESESLRCGNTEIVCRHLLEALTSGDETTAKFLVKWSNDNCTTDDHLRYTPLMLAAANGHVELLRLLLEGGANVESTNDYQWTALHVAAFYGNLGECRLLLERGAKVDPLDMSKETPLHHAASNGYLSVLKLLVEKGANVKLKNYYGKTASDMARSEGHSDVADWLDTQQVQ